MGEFELLVNMNYGGTFNGFTTIVTEERSRTSVVLIVYTTLKNTNNTIPKLHGVLPLMTVPAPANSTQA